MAEPRAYGTLARRLLLVLVAVALVPLVATVGLSYWSSRDVVAALLRENLGKTARIYASEVDDFLVEKTELLTALAGGVAHDDGVLAEVVSRSQMVEELILLDAEGAIVARSATGESWAVAACRAQASGIAPMKHAHHGHGHEVVVTVPSDDGGRLCGRISFTLHQDMISERARSSFGGLAYIVDRSGDVVCHAFEEHEPHVHPGEPIGGPAAEHARRGEPWHGVIEVDGIEHLASYAPATNLPWGVWAEVPMDEASAVLLRPLATRALLLGTVLTGLVSGMILLLVRRIVRDLDRQVASRTAELDEARRFSDTLLDTVEQRILVIGPGRTVIRANRAAVDVYGPAVVGAPCNTVHDTADGDVCPAESVLATGTSTVEEKVRHLPDGRAEILSVERYPIPGADGPRAVLEIERDVTELKQFQAHLVHREKMAALGALAAGLAHEIGNPLASLSSELEMLALEPAAGAESVPVLQDQVRRMGALLRELVDLGRAPSDQLGRVDAMEVVDDVLRLLRHSARDKNVRLERGPDGGHTLCTNRDRLVQVLLNLGLNAVDAVGNGGTVRFEVAPHVQGVVFVVTDDGPGLPDDRGRLFEPFYTTKPAGKGTGLGLFVVDRVVSSLGGEVVASNGASGGARFEVRFPDSSFGETDE